MCVGARRLGRGPCVALLLLGLGLSTATRLHCVGDTYPSNDRCCNECRPGNGMVSRCSRSQNTVCRPCGPGYYNDVVSSKPCKSCTWCNLRSGSERKQPCTATQDTVCRCRAGTQPLDSYKPGVGELGGCGRQLGVCVAAVCDADGPWAAGTWPHRCLLWHPQDRAPGSGPTGGVWAGRASRGQTHHPAVGDKCLPHIPSTWGLWAAPDHSIFVADCAPCPPGHFSPGDNQACKPWTNCTLAGKHTLQPASNSSDAICEDRDTPATQPQETQGPPARPTTVQPTEAWPRTSQGPSTRPVDVPGGRAVAAILGLGLVLGLLGPLAILLALYLLRRDGRLPPDAHKPPGRGSFRTPIQEEQADAHSTLAKI
nr:tumor necrosis factor receptor superfamily member 4 isoform X1 [Symphalangus syndactylus]